MKKVSMKTAGLIGGMSWESTALYYRHINEQVKNRLGGLHSAKLLLASVDFAEIEIMQHQGDWSGAGRILNCAGESLEKAGADFIVICTNTMHKVSSSVMAGLTIPLLHIVDPTAIRIREAGLNRIGLLGTGFTMSDDFYKGRMSHEHGIQVMVPTAAEQADIHRIIYEELCLGIIDSKSRLRYLEIIDSMAKNGAEGVILGCTEITLLVTQSDTAVPLFDTTRIHADATVDRALAATV